MIDSAPAWTRINLLSPDPALINLTEIATALSRTYRFHGQCPFTVAQHSVIVSRAVEPEHARAGLLHDAAEGLGGLSDLPTPIKYAPGFSAYRRLEEKYLRALAERFEFAYPLHPSIKRADKRALRSEVEFIGGVELARRLVPRVRPLDVRIKPWTPEVAREKFEAEAERLGLS